MNIALKELDNIRCAEYIKQRLIGMLYFSDKISRELDLNHGKFYTLTPNDVNPEYLYDFEIGGKVYPFKRDEGERIKQVANASDNIIAVSLAEYVKSDSSHCLCLEDYNADPDFSYIEKSDRQYYLIDNRVFYLLDNTLSSEKVHAYFKWAQGYGFLGVLLKISTGLKGLNINTGKELPNVVKEEIFKCINSFFIEIYDGESYLLWIDNREGKVFLDILSKEVKSLVY